MHRGGKIMQQVKAFGLISLIIMVIFGCAGSLPVSGQNQIPNNDFGFTAEAVPEGILLTFYNIPSEAVRLFISTAYTSAEEAANPYNYVTSFADVRDASILSGAVHTAQLDKVKQSGKVIFPITQPGQNYYISAMVWDKQGNELYRAHDENYFPPSAAAECVAENGIHFNSKALKLELNGGNSVVTLSSEPEFSSDVVFDTQKYSFGVTIDVPGKGAIGVASHHLPEGLSSNGLAWTFEPGMTADIKNDNTGWLESGTSYSAWARVNANIIYDDVTWFVEIAKSREFTYLYK
jgi:hypothetical protein